MPTKYKLIIKADVNDADYIHSVTDVTKEELEQLIPIFTAIKNFKPYKGKSESGLDWTHDSNWPGGGEYCPRLDLGEKPVEEIYDGILTPEQIDLFNNYRPYFGEESVHRIVSISVLEYIYEKELL
jgi:hypothetical protein